MTIYKISYDYVNFLSFLIENVELGTKMPSYSPRFRASPRAGEWVAPEAKFYASQHYAGADDRRPDVTTWLLGNLVLSPKAYETLGTVIKHDGEFLPVTIKTEQFYVFNTLYTIPYESTSETLSSSEVVNRGIQSELGPVVIEGAVADGHLLFKTPADRWVHTYCSEQFKSLVEQHNLAGLVFESL